MTLPPLDLNVAGLGNRRLRRRAMCIEHPYETRLAAYLKTHSSLDARELGRHLPALYSAEFVYRASPGAFNPPGR